MIEAKLNARLMTLSPNVYPNVAPANYRTPCAVYQRLETETFNDLESYSDEAFVTFQVSISSPIYKEAITLARAIRNNLRDWQEDGVQAASWLNEVVAVDDTTDVTLHRIMLFFKFFTAD
jgi:hypothetical protein